MKIGLLKTPLIKDNLERFAPVESANPRMLCVGLTVNIGSA